MRACAEEVRMSGKRSMGGRGFIYNNLSNKEFLKFSKIKIIAETTTTTKMPGKTYSIQDLLGEKIPNLRNNL